jgi:hypothetical protein
MNIGAVIMLCFASFLLGFMLGDWKEGKEVAKMAHDLSTMHYKEIHLIVNKILESRNKKGGEE